MAVDRKARDDLAVALRRLVTGRMTNDQFDDHYYYDDWVDSSDKAVSEIATFGWGLYSSDLLWPYKLKGCHAVSSEIRRTAARAILFLASKHEYEWPPYRETVTFWCLFGAGCYLVVGLVFLLTAGLIGGWMGFWYAILGILFTVPCIHWLATGEQRADDESRFHESGDVEVWPFLRSSDFEDARRSPRFLSGRRQ